MSSVNIFGYFIPMNLLIGGSVAVIALVVWLVKMAPVWEKEEADEERKINLKLSELGASRKDVDIFLEVTDFDIDDFVESEALQNQFKVFLKGETTRFIEDAKTHKVQEAAEAAKSSAHTATIIGAVALGNSMRRRS